MFTLVLKIAFQGLTLYIVWRHDFCWKTKIILCTVYSRPTFPDTKYFPPPSSSCLDMLLSHLPESGTKRRKRNKNMPMHELSGPSCNLMCDSDAACPPLLQNKNNYLGSTMLHEARIGDNTMHYISSFRIIFANGEVTFNRTVTSRLPTLRRTQ